MLMVARMVWCGAGMAAWLVFARRGGGKGCDGAASGSVQRRARAAAHPHRPSSLSLARSPLLSHHRLMAERADALLERRDRIGDGGVDRRQGGAARAVAGGCGGVPAALLRACRCCLAEREQRRRRRRRRLQQRGAPQRGAP